VGVHSSPKISRHHYNVRLESRGAMSGWFTFRLHDGRGREYIDMSQKMWDPWHAEWCWVRLSEVDPLFAEPSALLSSQADWQETDPRSAP
jgi:hypothetical protein